MEIPKKISLEICAINPNFSEEQCKIQIQMANNLYYFAKDVLIEMDPEFNLPCLEWSYSNLCDVSGNIKTEEVHQLRYKGAEVLSYTRVSDMEKIIYTPSISLGFLELLKQRGVKNLDNLLDSI